MIFSQPAATSTPASTRARFIGRLALLLAALTLSLTVTAVGGPAIAARPRVVTYPGVGRDVRLTAPDGLQATSTSFRRFVHHALVVVWTQSGKKPTCRSSALVTVKRWRSDGFAYLSNRGMFGACASGGSFQIVVRRHGAWVAPSQLSGQDNLYCATLRRYRIPRGIGQPSCYTADGSRLVPYPGPR